MGWMGSSASKIPDTSRRSIIVKVTKPERPTLDTISSKDAREIRRRYISSDAIPVGGFKKLRVPKLSSDLMPPMRKSLETDAEYEIRRSSYMSMTCDDVDDFFGVQNIKGVVRVSREAFEDDHRFTIRISVGVSGASAIPCGFKRVRVNSSIDGDDKIPALESCRSLLTLDSCRSLLSTPVTPTKPVSTPRGNAQQFSPRESQFVWI